ncbi:MAG: integrase [Deltaproteobacteria bacterium]|nr:MAG: integrase [Deltaproteobacteria bacterium]
MGRDAPAELGERVIWPVDRHPAAVYLARVSRGSRRTLRQALETIACLLTGGRVDAEGLDWAAIRYPHVVALRALLAERYAPATANKILSALRGVLRECWRLGYLPAEVFHQAIDVPPVKGKRRLRGRALENDEFAALFSVCAEDRTPAGCRDGALLAVLYTTGIRRREAVMLDLGDYDPARRELAIRRGKGGGDRVAYVSRGCARLLDPWVEMRGEAPGALFLPITRGGRIVLRRMTDQAVMHIVRKRADQAGIAPFSPHDLRRSFISHLLDAGVDIATVQQLAGHAQVQTTARYDRRGEEVKRQGIERLHLPLLTVARRG